ncbi:MAG TPA: sulfotransferase [Chthoniobacterales bacterium]|nr:sulfotransferase [Chthoniobacterales bacterium]
MRTTAHQNSGPDFIGIGAQKAGTGWLYEQLRNHPDFWMPPMKELHYFDRIAANPQVQRSLPSARKEPDRIRIARNRARDQRDADFLARFERLCGSDMLNLEGYAALFAGKGESIAGDITPGYSTLDAPAVEKIVNRFSDVRVIFMARDPVERAWSQLSMYIRRGLIDRFDPEAVDQIIAHLHRPEVRTRSYPSEIVRRWRRYLSADRFSVYFFDDLQRDPVRLRASIITFLGGNPNKSSEKLPPDYNAKATKEKLTLTESARNHLANFFKQELYACAQELGGPAVDWPRRYHL